MHRAPTFFERLKFSAIGLGLVLLGIHIILKRKWIHEKRHEALLRMGYPGSELQCSDAQLRRYHAETVVFGIFFILFGAFLMIASWIV